MSYILDRRLNLEKIELDGDPINGTRMMNHNDWLATRTKSVVVEKSITVNGCSMRSEENEPITLTVKAIELNYGPVISFSVTVDKPCNDTEDWDDHPFMHIKDMESPTEVGNIVEDTPAVRALIEELVAEPKNMYSTTDCTHRGRLIRAIMGFWS